MEDILRCVVETEWQTIWEAMMECIELVGLVWYFNNNTCKFLYILSFFQNS